MPADGFEAFYAAAWEPMVRTLTLAVGDRSVAEDAAQTGFERAFARWGRVCSLDRPAGWVYVVALREASRRSRRHPSTPPQPASADPFDEVDSAQWVIGQLQRLPARQREAVVLRHLGVLLLSEIAEAQGVAVGTVKASLHAAHRRLRLEVDREESEVEDAAR